MYLKKDNFLAKLFERVQFMCGFGHTIDLHGGDMVIKLYGRRLAVEDEVRVRLPVQIEQVVALPFLDLQPNVLEQFLRKSFAAPFLHDSSHKIR